MISKKTSGCRIATVTDDMNAKHYCIIPRLLSFGDCGNLVDNCNIPDRYRKTITLERYRFGLAEFNTLPTLSHPDTGDKEICIKLSPVTNGWVNTGC